MSVSLGAKVGACVLAIVGVRLGYGVLVIVGVDEIVAVTLIVAETVMAAPGTPDGDSVEPWPTPIVGRGSVAVALGVYVAEPVAKIIGVCEIPAAGVATGGTNDPPKRVITNAKIVRIPARPIMRQPDPTRC